jgi:[ribosomal protein S5]-alanine N-acetyltransferase
MQIELPRALSDGVVTLRPPRDDDVPVMLAAFRDDPGLGVALGMEEDPSEEKLLSQIARNDETAAAGAGAELAIAAAESDEFLGILEMVRFAWRHGRCEVGFWLVASARRQGLGRRAITLALNWAFGDLGMRRVELTTLPENEATVALARSLGFSEEGLLRRRNFERGRAVDVVWFGMLRDEWPNGT